MTKNLLAIVIVFSLTACHERRGPEPKISKYAEELFTDSKLKTPNKYLSENNNIIEDIPILDETLPILNIEEGTSIPVVTPIVEKQPDTTTKNSTSGRDIKTLRVSEGIEHTRIVFDTYISNQEKASSVGNYTFNYSKKQKRITILLSNYHAFSALKAGKVRTFSKASIINKIYLTKNIHPSSFQCQIDLNKEAKVNIFDIKKPGRIVIDISPK
jgi:hypothetical protein